MARTKLLTNIIQRKMMVPDEMSHSNLHHNFEISLYDFANHEILEKLYKADNQRSTECWSPTEIKEFILDCLNDRYAFAIGKMLLVIFILLMVGTGFQLFMLGLKDTLLMSK
jgi:hypothetical protein